MIFRLYLMGHNSVFIAKYLGAHEIKTVMGKTNWSSTVIDKMLINEKYVGSALLQKTYTVDYLTKQRVKNNGELSKYFIKNNHPPIILDEIFYCVQEEKLRRSYMRQQDAERPSRYPITSKLICSGCGNHFIRVTRKKDETDFGVWRCRSRISYGGRYCEKLCTITERELHNAIWEAYNRVVHTAPRSDDAELMELAKQMTEKQKTIRRIIKENVQGFWVWNDLTSFHAKVRREYYELCDCLFRKFSERNELIFMPCTFTHLKSYRHYKKYEDELVSLYVERIWTIASDKVIILFKNGSMVKEKWNY